MREIAFPPFSSFSPPLPPPIFPPRFFRLFPQTQRNTRFFSWVRVQPLPPKHFCAFYTLKLRLKQFCVTAVQNYV